MLTKSPVANQNLVPEPGAAFPPESTARRADETRRSVIPWAFFDSRPINPVRPPRPSANLRALARTAGARYAIAIAMADELTIIYEQGQNGWWIATIPEVPGAFSQGATRDEARANVLDALHELMAARRERALQARPEPLDLERLSLTATVR